MEKTVITKLEELNLLDKFLFDETMEDRESYQALISIVLKMRSNCLKSHRQKRNCGYRRSCVRFGLMW